MSRRAKLATVGLTARTKLKNSCVLEQTRGLVHPKSVIMLPVRRTVCLHSSFTCSFEAHSALDEFIVSCSEAVLDRLPLSTVSNFIFRGTFSVNTFSSTSGERCRTFLDKGLAERLVSEQLRTHTGSNRYCDNDAFGRCNSRLYAINGSGGPAGPGITHIRLPPSLGGMSSDKRVGHFIRRIRTGKTAIIPLCPTIICVGSCRGPTFRHSVSGVITC